MSASDLKKAIQFFVKHAGYSYKPGKETPAQGRRRTAISLAAAEQRRLQRGVPVLWEPDYDDARGEELFCARIPDASGRGSLASLCGIDDPNLPYRRVVEAELAAEAFPARTRRSTPRKRR